MNDDVPDIHVVIDRTGKRVCLQVVGSQWLWLTPEEAQKLSNDLQDAVDELAGQAAS